MTNLSTLPSVTFSGTFLELRNAALLLGGRESWKQRKVIAALGIEVCERALRANGAELEVAKKLLAAYFEAHFTDEDKQMEIALKKAEKPVYESEDDI